MMVGGWSDYRPVTDEEKKVVEEAYEGFIGFHFEPIIVSTQMVSGTNYHFVGTAGMPVPNAPKHIITVRIFKPLDGKATLV